MDRGGWARETRRGQAGTERHLGPCLPLRARVRCVQGVGKNKLADRLLGLLHRERE